jgi:predicted metal-dependent hydrolase
MSYDGSEIHEISFPEGPLRYELRWTARRRTVGIAIEPDRRVIVMAPRSAAPERVTALVTRRIRWIRRQWDRIDALPSPATPRQWVSGETHRYLGRQYRLKVRRAEPQKVRLQGGYFVVSVADPGSTRHIRSLMETWYRERAEALLPARVERAIASTTWLEVQPPAIRVGVLWTRWGSTSRAGRITFNVDLVKAPLPCVDYVVAHELVHLRIPNHSPAFWRMLSRVMPDWRKWRERLERVEI